MTQVNFATSGVFESVRPRQQEQKNAQQATAHLRCTVYPSSKSPRHLAREGPSIILDRFGFAIQRVSRIVCACPALRGGEC
jgi:hypothetical protein